MSLKNTQMDNHPFSYLCKKKDDRFRSGSVGFFVYPDRDREDIRALVGHDVRIPHDGNQVFEIPSGKVREPFVPAAKNKDVEPLDEQADERDHTIHPENNPNEDPVEDADEQFHAACILIECEELLFGLSTFGHTITVFNGGWVCVLMFPGTRTWYDFTHFVH